MIKRERRDVAQEPYFSICIPQYNRTEFLVAALRTIDRQLFRSFEICISDDLSDDGGEEKLLQYLESSGLQYCYVRQAKNLRYDGNLRAAIGLARGRYCVLLGNDDGFADENALRRVALLLEQNDEPAVALTNYRDAETRVPFTRVGKTEIAGSGPDVAVQNFRHFSFVSGVIIRRELAQQYSTAILDGSEMYQVYLVTRAIAAGERLLNIADVVIDKDLRIPGQTVDSYAAKPRLEPCPIVPRKLNLVRFPEVVSTALSFSVPEGDLAKYNASVIDQLYKYTYPYWLVEYRRVQSWRYALGIALGQQPGELSRGLELDAAGATRIRLRYLASTLGGLLAPVRFTQRFVAPIFYRMAKRQRT